MIGCLVLWLIVLFGVYLTKFNLSVESIHTQILVTWAGYLCSKDTENPLNVSFRSRIEGLRVKLRFFRLEMKELKGRFSQVEK